ncbi:MAG: HAD-IA family hydrolase [Pleurocapsa sp. SU_5_0]|nr:HAD-IA family hydrolase [Pleurocapsa sp. SU_5_0]
MQILDQIPRESLPRVIFFDAMGTLFDLKNSVGEIYHQYASKHGVAIDAKQIEQAFITSFKSAPPLAFLPNELAVIKQQEFDWWKQVVSATFEQLEVLENFVDFNAFFREIYGYFGTKEPWYVFPDTIDSLTKCRDRNIELGVISNFDSRLIEVLNLLDLDQFFTSITISSMAGFAKPEPNIFQIALGKHNLVATNAWHIGDSPTEDYAAAKNAGLGSLWLNRQAHSLNIENQLPNLWSLG